MANGRNMSRQMTFLLFACKEILMHMQAAVPSLLFNGPSPLSR